MAKHYRVYRLDCANHVAEVEWLDAVGDDEAMAIVQAKISSSKRELWLGERLVATFKPALRDEPSGAFWL